MLFNFALDCAIRTVQKIDERLKLTGHNLSAYAGDVNTVKENTDTVKKNTETLLHASKKVDLEVNPEKTNYMLISLSQKIGQNIAKNSEQVL
jgi:hypothetical protein